MNNIINMIKNIRTCCLALVLALTGCGLTQSVNQGSKSVAKSIFYKQVKILHLDFTARTELNPDIDGTPLATHIWVYQLKDRQAFDTADYTTLLSNADQLLKADFLEKKDLWIRPDSEVSLHIPLAENARYVAIMAQFRTPDSALNSWRKVLDRDDLDPDKTRVIELKGNSLQLVTSKK